MSDEVTEPTPAAKRPYVKREAEFYDLDIPAVQAVVTGCNIRLKEITKLLKGTDQAGFEALLTEKKEISHKRVRAYARLRALGYNAKEVRHNNAEAKKAAVAPTVVSTPVDVTPIGAPPPVVPDATVPPVTN